nr:DUF2913 family protein [uncultured Shewanella sp.]
MNSQTYNQAVLELALAGLADLTASAQTKKAQRTSAQESHFLCNWMVESLKEKRFSKLVAEDLTAWIRMARSQGAGAELKRLLERIVHQYQTVEKSEQALGTALNAMIATLKQAEWLVFTDTEISAKLKLDADGQSSLAIDTKEFNQHIKDNQLVKPINLYVRADEQTLTRIALSHGLLLSQGNKKTSLVKHHKTYQIFPHNQQPALCQLLA